MPKNAFFTLKPTLLGVLLFLGLFLGRFRHFSGSRWAIPKKWPPPKTRLTRGFTEIWPDWPVATNFLKLSISFTCVLWLNLWYSYIFSFLHNREIKVGKWAKTGLTRGFTTKLRANKWAKWPSETVKWTKKYTERPLHETRPYTLPTVTRGCHQDYPVVFTSVPEAFWPVRPPVAVLERAVTWSEPALPAFR